MKDGAYLRYLDECKSIVTYCIVLYANANSGTYLSSFGVTHNPEEIKRFTGNENIIINIFRIHAYDVVMREYFSIEFIDLMFI